MRPRSDSFDEGAWPRILADALRGHADAWARVAGAPPDAFLRAASSHGVAAILAGTMPGDVPAIVADRLRAERVASAARDAVAGAALAAVTTALADAGIDAVIFKGADLAYSCYGQSYLRGRTDSDVLVATAARDAAASTLAGLGYAAVPQAGGELVMYQEAFVLADGDAVRHTVDLHWRAVNPQPFRLVAPFETLWGQSRPRPRHGPPARGLAPAHAFAIACVHRLAHHYDVPRVIWTYDLHLLAGEMAREDWRELTRVAAAWRIAGACIRGVELATGLFDTAVPPEVMDGLARAAAGEASVARYSGGRRHAARVAADVASLPSWRARAALARQYLFPPADYMRQVYAPDSALPVVALYAVRAWKGARRWMART